MAASFSCRPRLRVLDLARGTAVLAMVLYHLCFDLIHFGFAHALFEGAARDMNHHAGWMSIRALILGSFVLISGYAAGYSTGYGAGLTTGPEAGSPARNTPPAAHSGKRPHPRQLWQLGTAALIVSAGSYMVFPDSWIDFGVIHFFFCTRLLYPYFPSSPKKLALLILAFALLSTFSHPFFDTLPWRWIGLTTHKPFTEDYVPLLPWLAVFLAGLLLASRANPFHVSDLCTRASCNRTCSASKTLEWAGRHSLLIYLIHQPLLWGACMLAASFLRT